VSTVTDLNARRRRRELQADLAGAQRLYARITSKATAERRRRFRRALELGASIEEIAAATGLEADEVRAALSQARVSR
jgi:hypothetical protein